MLWVFFIFRADNYKTVSFDIKNSSGGFQKQVGILIIYSIAVIENEQAKNKKGGALFVNLLLSKEGQKIIEQSGQDFVNEVHGDTSILK